MTAEPSQPKTAIEHFNNGAPDYEKYTGGCTREVACALLELPELADVGAPGSVVLDNACGTGIVTEEIIKRCRTQESAESGTTAAATVYLADAASNMVDIALRKLQSLAEEERFTVTGHVMPGERLVFEDNTFTHSITNLGILFYKDGPAGSRELYRTLSPGGVAVVTTWTDLGYLEPIIKPAQAEVRPDDPPYQLPLSLDWLSASHLESVLAQGGFGDVRVSEMKAHYGAETLEELVGLLAHSFRIVCKAWSDDEKTRFRALVHEKTARVVEQYKMPDGRAGVGIPMRAAVAVCRK